ncbi:MAG: class I SAM-dependent methyltransferase [Nitrospiraceae bacterium]|nr:MAG: class I SAM-dependent methyltransferase [Nitrospiraceae bacterium]
MNAHSAKLSDRILDAYKSYGLKSTIQASLVAVLDYLFDFRYGTDTVSHVELKNLDINSENYSRGHRYASTPAIAFKKLLDAIEFPDDSVFVDIGCGKGKMLLLAPHFGFKRVVGVDFSEKLCECARKNISIYQQKTGRNAHIDVIHSDVVHYEIKDDENVFYLFNPFDEVILKKVLDNICSSVEKNPRPVYLIYYIPYYRKIIERHGSFIKLRRYFFSGCEFIIYGNKPADQFFHKR